MPSTVYLEPNQVPPQIRGDYTGTKFQAVVCETVTIPADAGLWSEGSRETFKVVRLADGAALDAANHAAAPWDGTRRDVVVRLEPGIAVVEHSFFRGKDMGLRIHVCPTDAAPMLPAPPAMVPEERTILMAHARLKSSYGGKDRYELAMEQAEYDKDWKRMTRTEWDTVKALLIAGGYLNKAGAITTKGRNAVNR